MIRDQQEVFLGAVVQPKMLTPVWVLRKPGTFRTAVIMTKERFGPAYHVVAGEGYLDGGDMDDKYQHATTATGFPRAHTPSGVRIKGAGYGTCLYTGLVLVASAIEDKETDPDEMPGEGSGICSSVGTRSSEADQWWDKALRRKLTSRDTYEVDGVEGEETEETEEDVDLDEYMNRRDRDRVREAIKESVSNYGEGYPSSIVIRGDITRMVESSNGEITADIYTLRSAEKHKLVAVRELLGGTLTDWAKAAPTSEADYHKDVLLALNVSNEDLIMVGKLALCAQAAGASEVEMTGMVIRNRFGIDMLDRAIGKRSIEEFIERSRQQRMDYAGAGVMLEKNPRRRRPVPDHEPPPRFRANPPPEPTRAEIAVLERELNQLAERRAKLGWDKLEDLP